MWSGEVLVDGQVVLVAAPNPVHGVERRVKRVAERGHPVGAHEAAVLEAGLVRVVGGHVRADDGVLEVGVGEEGGEGVLGVGHVTRIPPRGQAHKGFTQKTFSGFPLTNSKMPLTLRVWGKTPFRGLCFSLVRGKDVHRKEVFGGTERGAKGAVRGKVPPVKVGVVADAAGAENQTEVVVLVAARVGGDDAAVGSCGGHGYRLPAERHDCQAECGVFTKHLVECLAGPVRTEDTGISTGDYRPYVARNGDALGCAPCPA